MAHDEAADQARADAPTGLPDIIELALFGLEFDVESAAEILAEIVAGARLQRQSILHHGFDGEGPQRAREFLGAGFLALDYRHGHDVFGHVGVNIQHAQHFFLRLLVRGVRGVALLPEELGGAKEHAGAQLPADDVGPLVEEHGQVAIALDPLREEVADDGFRRRADDVGLFQLLAARDGDDGELGRETFDVFGFLLQKALRDQQREIDVLMAGGLEALVELALQHFPDGIAIGLDDHAAFDDFGRLGHIAVEHDVLVPGSEVLAALSDGRFGHDRGKLLL